MSSSTEMEHKLYLFELPEDLLTYPSLHIGQAYLDLSNVNVRLELHDTQLKLAFRKDSMQLGIAFDIPEDRHAEFLKVFPQHRTADNYVDIPMGDPAYSSRLRQITTEDGQVKTELTIKGPPRDTSWGCEEATLPLTTIQWQLSELFFAKCYQGQRITKQRYLVPTGVEELLWEVDVFKGHLSGLITAECEVPSENVPCPPPLRIGAMR